MGDDWDSLFGPPPTNTVAMPTMNNIKQQRDNRLSLGFPSLKAPQRKVSTLDDLDFDSFKINLSAAVAAPTKAGKQVKRVPYAGGDYFGYCYMTEHLSKKEGFNAFQALLEAHWAQENLCFWKKVEDLQSAPPEEVHVLALQIYNDHCKPGCPMPLNVSGTVMETVRKTLPHLFTKDTFNELQIDVSKSMQLNYWTHYMHSYYHVNFLEAKFRRAKVPVPKDKKKRRKPAVYATDDQNADEWNFLAEDNPFSEESSEDTKFSMSVSSNIIDLLLIDDTLSRSVSFKNLKVGKSSRPSSTASRESVSREKSHRSSHSSKSPSKKDIGPLKALKDGAPSRSRPASQKSSLNLSFHAGEKSTGSSAK